MDNFRKPNRFDIEEMKSMRDGSLWWIQINNWCDNTKELGFNCNEDTEKIFRLSATVLRDSILNDYKLVNKYCNIVGVLLLSDFDNMIKQIQSNTLNIVSGWISIMIKEVISNSNLQKKVNTGVHSKKCINPDCDKIVDLSKNKSGACCKEHMNYECENEKCLQRAKENGWKRSTHAYNTKIGIEHLQFKKK